MVINSNVFYVASENIVYICWEKVPGLVSYRIYRDGQDVTERIGQQIRPYEFDNDHHTELYKPATRNWLYVKDRDINKLTKYSYKIVGESSRTVETYESLETEVKTE